MGCPPFCRSGAGANGGRRSRPATLPLGCAKTATTSPRDAASFVLCAVDHVHEIACRIAVGRVGKGDFQIGSCAQHIEQRPQREAAARMRLQRQINAHPLSPRRQRRGRNRAHVAGAEIAKELVVEIHGRALVADRARYSNAAAAARLSSDGPRIRGSGVNNSIEIGIDERGQGVRIEVQELLATRLLVQGNSGSGKSHLLRRLLEQSAGLVQQVVIDPEGDFVTLADAYSHVAIDAGDYNEREIATMGARIREHRASVVLNLEALDIEAQMGCAAAFLNALFDAPREHWFPALVVVDEAQMFAPSASGDVSDAVRRASLSAMTNLMCRGRKRGLAGAIATQRLAKLAKNVAAEASNFLMGRTFLDIDMARAADLLGMERRQAEAIRDLERGHFLGLGPAIARRPVAIRIGATETRSRAGTHSLLPLPDAEPQDMRTMLFAEMESAAPPPVPPRPVPVAAAEVIERIAHHEADASAADDVSAPAAADSIDAGAVVEAVLRDMLGDAESAYQPETILYQDFSVRCRMQRLRAAPFDLAEFRRRFALAKGGILDPADPHWRDLLGAAARLPDDMLAPFLLIARAAMDGAPCPDEEALGRAYGTRSPGRVRRLLDYMEKQGVIVVRSSFGGQRSIHIPELGLATEAA